MSAPQMVTWWTMAEGWKRAPEPDAFAQLRAQNGVIDHRAAGYERQIDPFPPEMSYPAGGSINVRQHDDHLMVEVWDGDMLSTLVFVPTADAAAFRMTVLPRVMQAMASVWQAEEIRLIRRALVAFVRHGHGERTINDDGTEDRDEAAARVRWQEYERAARRMAEQGGSGR